LSASEDSADRLTAALATIVSGLACLPLSRRNRKIARPYVSQDNRSEPPCLSGMPEGESLAPGDHDRADTISNPRFYQTEAVRDSEPIFAIPAVSRIHFRRSENLHICKSNSLDVAGERRRLVISRPEPVVLERPIFNRSVSQLSEPLQRRRGETKV
jgi:hypothetical protein